ncbi:hypothetical protein HK103_004343 [Boothiomyces macroporosus]|uniref:Uncharacterized protein n=1 Tax=Boothiomyces macroporosus TaxID=261099 RepID=A0AAD5UJD2_9FUNG|nr:hypothetical protein HK103_004343 [Boothiomyces macroporosus]
MKQTRVDVDHVKPNGMEKNGLLGTMGGSYIARSNLSKPMRFLLVSVAVAQWSGFTFQPTSLMNALNPYAPPVSAHGIPNQCISQPSITQNQCNTYANKKYTIADCPAQIAYFDQFNSSTLSLQIRNSCVKGMTDPVIDAGVKLAHTMECIVRAQNHGLIPLTGSGYTW